MPAKHAIMRAERFVRMVFEFFDVLTTCYLVISEIVGVDSRVGFARAADETLATVSPNHRMQRTGGSLFS